MRNFAHCAPACRGVPSRSHPHPTPLPLSRGPSLPLYFSDWERSASTEPKKEGCKLRTFHSRGPPPPIPRDGVRFSPKAFPPLPSALGSPASLLWTEEGKACPDRCECFSESTTSPNPGPQRTRWGLEGKARYFGGQQHPSQGARAAWRAPRRLQRGWAEWLDYVSNSPPCAHHHLLIS